MGGAKRNTTLDALKAVAAIGIILIHFKFPGNFGKVIQVIARCGVPVFFMCSGFYLNAEILTLEKLKRKETHIFRLLLLGILTYFIYNVFSSGFCETLQDITFQNTVKFVVFNAPQVTAPHLWFCSALMYSYGLVFLIYHTKLNKYNEILIVALICIHIVLSEGFGLMNQELAHPFVRNAYLFGVPFLLMGCWISENQKKIEEIKDKYLLCATLIGFYLSVLERYCLPNDNLLELYIGSVISSISLFVLCSKHTNLKCSKLCFIGSRYSMGMYIFHPMLGDIIGKIEMFNSIAGVWVKPIIIIFLSIIVGGLVDQISIMVRGFSRSN